MRIGILETGVPPLGLKDRFGDYPSMVRALLGEGFETETFDVVADGPPQADGFAGYVITGSAAGVYDELPWIAPLAEFLRAQRGRSKMVGICFGHQIMAQAFGGQVIKSPKGWGIGLQRYEVAARAGWMDGGDAVAIPASHQDQVVQRPPGATVTLASDFTPYAGLAYDDGLAISFQAHPEFAPAFAVTLIESRRGARFADAEADAAIASLGEPNDRARVGEWIRRFLAD